MDEQKRRRGIGGSDIAAILGVDEYRDPFAVWAQKTGQLSYQPPTPRQRMGKVFERGIIAFYSELTGRPTEFLDETRVHPQKEFLVYTPDALCTQEPRGVDAKVVHWDQSHKWGDTSAAIPFHAQLQAHHYMLCTGFLVWDVVAWVDGDPRIYPIYSDPEVEAFIEEKAERFWVDHVLTGQAPPIGASEDSSRFLRERFPSHREPPRLATAEEILMVMKYSTIASQYRDLGEQKKAQENAIKLVIGEDAGLQWPGGKFTWRKTRDSEETDWEAVAEEASRLLPKEQYDLILQDHTRTKEGTRRIYFHMGGQK